VSKATGYVVRRTEGYPPVEEVENDLEAIFGDIAEGTA